MSRFGLESPNTKKLLDARTASAVRRPVLSINCRFKREDMAHVRCEIGPSRELGSEFLSGFPNFAVRFADRKRTLGLAAIIVRGPMSQRPTRISFQKRRWRPAFVGIVVLMPPTTNVMTTRTISRGGRIRFADLGVQVVPATTRHAMPCHAERCEADDCLLVDGSFHGLTDTENHSGLTTEV
jgi:hypothetical protein